MTERILVASGELTTPIAMQDAVEDFLNVRTERAGECAATSAANGSTYLERFRARELNVKGLR